jgi:hypothetical protein
MAEIEETPQVQTAAGAGSNGNTDGVDDAAGSEVSRQPQTEEKLWTQAEVEKLIQERLTTAEQRQAKKRDDAARQARVDEAKKAGNLELALKERDDELAQARQELADFQTKIKQAELASLRAAAAAKHFPDRKPGEIAILAARLVGDDEPAIEADALALRKLLGPRGAPDPQAGQRGDGTPSEKELAALEKSAALNSGRYGSY